MSIRRHPVAMLYIALPLNNVTEWDSDNLISQEMAKRVKEVDMPNDAYSTVWFSFLPESQGGKNYVVQEGFFADSKEVQETESLGSIGPIQAPSIEDVVLEDES